MPFRLILVEILLTTASGDTGVGDCRSERLFEVLCIRNVSKLENRFIRSVLGYPGYVVCLMHDA